MPWQQTTPLSLGPVLRGSSSALLAPFPAGREECAWHEPEVGTLRTLSAQSHNSYRNASTATYHLRLVPRILQALSLHVFVNLHCE